MTDPDSRATSLFVKKSIDRPAVLNAVLAQGRQYQEKLSQPPDRHSLISPAPGSRSVPYLVYHHQAILDINKHMNDLSGSEYQTTVVAILILMANAVREKHSLSTYYSTTSNQQY